MQVLGPDAPRQGLPSHRSPRSTHNRLWGAAAGGAEQS